MGSAMAEPCYVRMYVRMRSTGLLWPRIRSWHTNRDSEGVRFNTPFHGLVWWPPFELASSAA